jgi:glutamate dehydrogenase
VKVPDKLVYFCGHGNILNRFVRVKRMAIKGSSELNQQFVDEDGTSGTAAGISSESLTGEQLEQYIADVARTVRENMNQGVETLTPWFFNNMPSIYYQTTPSSEKVSHLQALITSDLFETKQTLTLWDKNRSKVTYIGPGGDHSILSEVASRLTTFQMKIGSLYVSRDDKLFIGTFSRAEHVELDRKNPRIVEKIRIATEMMLAEHPSDAAEIAHYIEHLDNEFVMYSTAARIQLTYRMVRYMKSHEGAHTLFEPVEDRLTARLTLGLKNGTPGEALEQIFNLLNRYGVTLSRVFVVSFRNGFEAPISVIHFHIASTNGAKINTVDVPMIKLNKALRTMGWVDSDEYSAFMAPQYAFSINAVNLVRSWASWLHVMLGKDNAYYYSHYKIRSTFFKYPELVKDLVHYFRMKFDPGEQAARDGGQIKEIIQNLNQKIEALTDEVERNIMVRTLSFIDKTEKTNYFSQTKTGLAFRLNPDVLDKKHYPERPYCIFFIVGRDYRMFHTRWKDIARGGLRVVMPRNSTDFEVALAGHYDEVYGLSHAQQLKNKDIPEGGAKGVLVLKPGGDRVTAVRGGVNALLDLLVRDDESREAGQAKMVSYYDKDDIIYLGPDENITNDLIEWIPAQAARRGYPYAAAFMSSKPGAGINHKEYGVTSEGINVFVENMLKFLKIDPRKQSFTVKMTGGPDGDVAGNELKILFREYGENARVVAIGDGTGAAYDADGLQWKELLRLFSASLGIAEFNKSCLKGKGAFVIKADTPENMKIRSEIHATVDADILIPGGGRPYTVNDRTWELFIKNGRPTVRAIIEGANIFFTAGARKKLQEHGILMIKDSSANKTGVICSSYEIIASLTLSEKEFLEIKPVYVSQVIDILRIKADNEAKLLFREFLRSGGKRSLVELSMDVSREINEVTDVLLEELTRREKEVEKDQFFMELVLAHCPKILVEKYRARTLEKLPLAHKIATLAAYMASNIVYREGLGWLDRIAVNHRYNVCLSYMKNDKLRGELVSAVEHSGLPNKDKIMAILERSATRDLTILGLEHS